MEAIGDPMFETIVDKENETSSSSDEDSIHK
jgi:hypothetical protein